MNAVQMQYEFNNYLRGHDIEESVPSDDVELYLNQAQDFVLDKYAELYNKESFARTFLSSLITSKRYTSSDDYTNDVSLPNSSYFELPSDFKYNIVDLEQVQFILNSITYKSRVKPVLGDHINLNTNNPFKKPYKDMVWRINYGEDSAGNPAKAYQIILPAGAVIEFYYITYIRYPDSIDIFTNNTCELDVSVHKEIVIKAVDLFLKSIQNNVILKNSSQNS